MKKNKINKFKAFSFHNLSQISFIDLSDNYLNSLKKLSFVKVPSLYILYISNNLIFDFDMNAFLGMKMQMLATTNTCLCCIKSCEAICGLRAASYASCSDLFPKVPMRIMLMSVTSAVFLLNIVSLFLHIWKDTKKKENKFHAERQSYEIIVCIISSSNLILGAYLAILRFADIYYNKDFIVKEFSWINSLVCYLVFILHLLFNLILPYMFSLLSFERLLVVINPMKTKFNSGRFITNSLSLVCLL